MSRLPIIPTIIVAAAIAVMVGLGVWQLQRAEWKSAIIARHEGAAERPAVAWPGTDGDSDALLYRRASGICLGPVEWRAAAGRNRAEQSGWSHVATCANDMVVDMGWSRSGASPTGWNGGEVSGIIAPYSRSGIRLVSAAAAPGLEPSAPPSVDAIPNNHLFYAFQWFFFAAAAALIYGLALRRRQASKER